MAFELAGRGENAAEAFDGVEIGVGEVVMAIDGCGAGIVAEPGTEVTGGVDVADGFGIDDVGGIEHGLTGTDVGELEVLNHEFQGRFVGMVRFDDELDVLAEDLCDGEGDAGFGRLDVKDVAAGVRRDVELHAVDVDASEVSAEVEEIVEGGAEGEVVDAEHGRGGVALLLLEIGLGGACEIKDAEAMAVDFEAARDGDGERIEFDGRVEARGEGRDDAAAKDGAGVAGDVLGCDGEGEDR
jgi:hypothetical protein